MGKIGFRQLITYWLALFLMMLILTIPMVWSEEQEPQTPVSKTNCVILLHGLARTAKSFSTLEATLKAEGYAVVNVDYPSRKNTIQILADRYIADAIQQCHLNKTHRIHFVTHSMGGILVRYYLKHHTLTLLGNVVMLSPPNQGSEVVDKIGKLPGFYLLNGPAGQQLGTSETMLPNQLGAVDYPVGVITGNRSINPILSLLIPGEDDGKVSIDNAKVIGMRDFLVVPHTHPLIMNSEKVIEESIYFLQHGMFM